LDQFWESQKIQQGIVSRLLFGESRSPECNKRLDQLLHIGDAGGATNENYLSSTDSHIYVTSESPINQTGTVGS